MQKYTTSQLIKVAVALMVVALPSVALSALCSSTIPQGSAESCDSITQYGITWTLDTNYTVGQFVNGDYWVVDPGDGVKIIEISPGHALHPNSGLAINGSMINPHTTYQGYDGFMGYPAALYKESYNVGIGVSSSTPLILSGNTSLVSTISNLDAGVGNKPYVKTAAVLTCLSSAPPEGSFRPGISSTTKTLHNISSIDYSKLKSFACPSGFTKPDIRTYANYFQMVFLSHSSSYTSVFFRPTDSGLDKYYFPLKFSEAALMLLIDYTNEEKTPLLINFIQLGIDIYSQIERGPDEYFLGWAPDGGHSHGRKWPILFTGIMLNYAPMKNIGLKSGDYLFSDGHGVGNPPVDYVHFGEDGQTFYVTQADVDITNSPAWYWKDEVEARPYTKAMIGMPEWGIRASINPEQSNSSWSANYRTIGSGARAWAGVVLAAYLMDAKTLWNHNALFDYTDRYVAVSKGYPDPFGYTVDDEKIDSYVDGIIGEMWDAYRHDYPYPPYSRAARRLSLGGRPIKLAEPGP